jgi:hypothetical protein
VESCHILAARRRNPAILDVARPGALIAPAATVMAMRSFLVLLPLIAGCVGNIQRAARVPHPGVPLGSGQPLASPAELSLGLSNVTDMVKPAVGDASQAVEVPGTEMRDEVRIRLGRRGQIGLVYEQGFGGTSEQPDKTQAPVGNGDVMGFGVSGGYAFETSTPGLSVSLIGEMMGWSVPYVEYTTCTNCLTSYTVVSHGRANPVTLGLGVAPSYRSGPITVFGGAFARNHPTTLRKEMNTDITFGDEDADVHSGPVNLLLHAGVELALAPKLSALVVVHQDVVANPVRYGPGVGIALTGRLGD